MNTYFCEWSLSIKLHVTYDENGRRNEGKGFEKVGHNSAALLSNPRDTRGYVPRFSCIFLNFALFPRFTWRSS